MNPFTLHMPRHRLHLGRRTLIMGIVNVTPDSFSDGGRFYAAEDAITQAERLAREGADLIDIGGESTRPYSEAVSENEECRRVLPVIETLASRLSIPISIDTTKAFVARRALEAGAALINDVGALRLDSELGAVAAESGVPIILMHMQGTPKTMQTAPHYDDLIGEIREFLQAAVTRAIAAGVDRSKIIVDPGIGFGKTFGHNFLLLKRLSEFESLDLPILIGPSRKAFIRNALQSGTSEEPSPDLPAVEQGTQAAVCAAVLNGAHIVRVHNVAMARVTVQIADAIRYADSRN